jgi:hypothetical protein
MSSASFILDRRGLRRADDRRFSVALGTSLVLHVLAIAALRVAAPMLYASPQAGAGTASGIQAVILGPRTPSVPAALIEPEAALPELVQPPQMHALLPPLERFAPPTGPAVGGTAARLGPNTPELSIAVGTLGDLARLGPVLAAQLARRFPEPVAKQPMLLGSPIVAYPQAALASGAERRVLALCTLRADGSIEDTRLVGDEPLFGPAVLDALKGVRFAPAEIDGNAVPYWAIVEVVFSIGRPATPPAARGPARRGLVFPPQRGAGR